MRQPERRAVVRAPPGAARAVDSPPPHLDLLARRHLLARGQPAEDDQHRGQRGIRASQAILNGAQGLPLPFAHAHYGPSVAAAGWRPGAAGGACVSVAGAPSAASAPPAAGLAEGAGWGGRNSAARSAPAAATPPAT